MKKNIFGNYTFSDLRVYHKHKWLKTIFSKWLSSGLTTELNLNEYCHLVVSSSENICIKENQSVQSE